MILVVGGTGAVGRHLLSALGALGEETRALVRDMARVPRLEMPTLSYIVGDVADESVLERAMDGVASVFLSMANGPDQRKLEELVIDAAAKANVEHIVKLSAPIVSPDDPVAVSRMHFALEQRILASSLSYTFLRPYGFMQNLLRLRGSIGHAVAIIASTGDARLNLVDTRDVADVAAKALVEPYHRGKTHVLTGSESVSYPELARRLSKLRYKISYVHLPPSKYGEYLRRQRLPDWLTEHILEIEAFACERPQRPTSTVQRVLARAPRSLDDFLLAHLDELVPLRAA